MSDYEFIKEFGNISIKKICKDLKISVSNIYHGTASKEKMKLVRCEISKRIKELDEKRKSTL